MRQEFAIDMIALGPMLVSAVLLIPIAGVIALAAYKMCRLELYGLAVTASVLAMLPCHPGFLIGLPIGLWSLIVLARPDTKAAFRQSAADRFEAAKKESFP